MHEKALMDDLMRKVLEVSRANGDARVAGVRVWLGALSHMTPEHFAEHFVDAARGTPAEGAAVTSHLDDDPGDPRAEGVVLEAVSLATGDGAPPDA